GFLLSQAVERWQSRALWVLSRADAQYPQRLKARLKSNAPPILYGCGPLELLERGGFAVVGSRHVDDGLIESTMAVGDLAARAHKVVVSGGAKGIDQAAMTGALEAGGQVVGVLADSLEKAALKREHRNYIRDGKLVLVSPYDPSAGFNVGHAMQRNKLIYGLSDASLVMSSDLERGGTWAGAIEQLDRLHFVPVYIKASGETSNGLSALLKRGGLAWPDPPDIESFDCVFQMKDGSKLVETNQHTLDLSSYPAGSEGQIHELLPQSMPDAPIVLIDDFNSLQIQEPAALAPTLTLAETLLMSVRQAFQSILEEPLKEADIASRLELSTPQVKLWLKRFIEEGLVVKHKKPAGYIAKQSRLFR
ncbi:MAG: DNA-processing protein DprA, partial [Janthinobacterium lividum]